MRESLKSMLAMGWNIERTKEGEAMFQQRESEKLKKISESLVTKHLLYMRLAGIVVLMLDVDSCLDQKSHNYSAE